MFKLFENKSIKEAIFNKEAIIEDLPKVASKMYPKEVQEIHNEFDIAADKLVEQAKSIIAESAKLDIDKVSRLEKLGFKQVAQVTTLKPMIEKSKISEEQIKLVKYYQENYPLNKFITEEQVKEICHKYNLVCGDVDRFKGFVPEKNLREIENFKLKEKDYSDEYEYGFIKSLEEWNSRFKPSQRIKGGRSNGGTLRYEEIFNSIVGKEKLPLKICAPVKDMDISGLKLVEGYKLEKKHIPDPVVLQPVNGGFLICSVWGDEASDPIVQNPINN